MVRLSNKGMPHRARSASEPGEIYLATDKVNGKKYVGQVYSLSREGKPYGTPARWIGHQGDARSHAQGKRDGSSRGCRVLNAAIIKHGAENFTIEVLLRCGANMLDHYEATFIDAHNSLARNRRGYNLKSGGDSNGRADESTRKMMSEARTGEKHHQWQKARTDDEKNKISCNLVARAERLDLDGTPLPKYMKPIVEPTRCGYIIVSHPLIVRSSMKSQSKVSFSTTRVNAATHPAVIEELKSACVTYLNHLNMCITNGDMPISKSVFLKTTSA